jgi:VWFA-related protein
MSVQPDQTGERGSMADAQIREIMELSSGFEKRSSDRAQVGNLATGMSMLAQVLGSVSGRKDVIYLSEGFDNEALAASEDFVENARMNQAAEKGEIWNIDSQKRYGDTTHHSLLRKLTDTLQQAECVVHSVDLGTPALAETLEDGDVSARAGGNQGLSLLASETGGSYTRNVSHAGRSIERILDDLSVTYVLSFKPTDLLPDGEYHKLKVRLAKGVEKARVEHRPGYFAPRPASQRAPAERRLELTEKLMAGGDGGSIPVSVIAVPIAKSSDLFYVPMFIEVDGPTLLAGRDSGRLETHILVYAFDSTGRVCDLFNHKVGLDLDQVGSALNRRGLKFFGDLYLRPGSYDVRVLVVDEVTARSQLRSVRLETPEVTSTAMSMTPPLVPDPQGLWVLTRGSGGSGGSTQEEYPFQVAGRSFVPAAMPVVPSTGSTSVVVMTQGEPADAASLRIRLLDPAGRLLAEPTCSSPRSVGTVGYGRGAISTEMRTSGLEVGACTLEVAIQARDGETVTSTIPCVVGTSNETPSG